MSAAVSWGELLVSYFKLLGIGCVESALRFFHPELKIFDLQHQALILLVLLYTVVDASGFDHRAHQKSKLLRRTPPIAANAITHGTPRIN